MYSFDRAKDLKPGLIGVYAIFVSSMPKQAYIGSSKDIRGRLMAHYSKLLNKKHDNWRLRALFHRYQEEFRWKILDKFATESEARAAEQTMIDFTDPKDLYNIDRQVYNYEK